MSGFLRPVVSYLRAHERKRVWLGAYRARIDKELSMLRKSFVFNCPEGATFSERSLRKSLDTSPLTLRILFVEMAAGRGGAGKKERD